MALVDYSSMEKEIANAPEPTILKKGQEVKARIIAVDPGVSHSEKYDGVSYYNVRFDVPAQPLILEFRAFFWAPEDWDKVEAIDPKQVTKAKDQFNKFTRCFGINLSQPFSWEDDLPGKEGWIIGGEPQKDPEYGDKGTIGKFITGPKGVPGQSADTVGKPLPENCPF
jgi:hypothetical protein